MLRADFTVVLKNGTRYSANHLSIGCRQVYQADALNFMIGVGAVSTLSFISSGTMITVDASDVEDVKFSPTGVSHCGECDQSLWGWVGHDSHANPKAPGVSQTQAATSGES